MTPAPRTVRLWTTARDAAPEPPPFGLGAWSVDEGEAVAVLLHGPDASLGDASAIAPLIPSARTLEPGAAVVILGTAARRARLWRRLLSPRAVKIARAPRCAALLVLGYVDLGAGIDGTTGADLVWGYVPAGP